MARPAKRLGNWHTICTRMNCWTKAGVLNRVFSELHKSQIVRIKIEAVALDSTSIKVHPDGTGAPRKNGPQSIGKSLGGWNTKIHMVAAESRTATMFGLCPSNVHDVPAGRARPEHMGPVTQPIHLLMDRAYESNETRQLALDLRIAPVVPPKSKRIEPWEYNRALYKRRNEVEKLFRRLKGYLRIFSRFEKLEVMFLGLLSFVLFADGLQPC